MRGGKGLAVVMLQNVFDGIPAGRVPQETGSVALVQPSVNANREGAVVFGPSGFIPWFGMQAHPLGSFVLPRA